MALTNFKIEEFEWAFLNPILYNNGLLRHIMALYRCTNNCLFNKSKVSHRVMTMDWWHGCDTIVWGMGTYHAWTLGKVLFCLSLRYEWFYLLCGVITGVEVCADHCLDDLGVIGHLCHDPGLHVFHARGVHGSVDLGLLALRYTSKTNGWNKNWSCRSCHFFTLYWQFIYVCVCLNWFFHPPG